MYLTTSPDYGLGLAKWRQEPGVLRETASTQNGSKSHCSISLICTGSRRIPASISTSQGPEKGGVWILEFGLQVSGDGFQVSGFRFRVSGFGVWVKGNEHHNEKSRAKETCSFVICEKRNVDCDHLLDPFSPLTKLGSIWPLRDYRGASHKKTPTPLGPP